MVIIKQCSSDVTLVDYETHIYAQFNSAAAKPNIKQNQNLLFIISSVQLNRGHHELMEIRAALFHESYNM